VLRGAMVQMLLNFKRINSENNSQARLIDEVVQEIVISAKSNLSLPEVAIWKKDGQS
jgi:hypothetical protein